MTRKLPKFTLPTWSGTLNLGTLDTWRREFTRVMRGVIERVVDQINSQVQGVGSDLVVTGANASIDLSAAIHHVGGTGSLQYINLPIEQIGTVDEVTERTQTSFTGPIFVIPTGAWTTDNTGVGSSRIASANTTAVVGRVMIFVYDGSAWFSSY